jgi:tRNA U34 5-methylaminomethyl-2-thiouridine-forming methyltransferase MnmC
MTKIIQTDDRSVTLFSEKFKEHYHSIHGAVNESRHVYINAGLKQIKQKRFNVFEMGFGTGLNAYLTALYAKENRLNISYSTVELYPVEAAIYNQIDQMSGFDAEFLSLHQSEWSTTIKLNENFSFRKDLIDILNFKPVSQFNLVFYDAFAPDTQPELWTLEVFKSLYEQMSMDGILVTYAAKGQVRRNLQDAGFEVERLAGPLGKREMLRAKKV